MEFGSRACLHGRDGEAGHEEGEDTALHDEHVLARWSARPVHHPGQLVELFSR